MTAKKKYRKRRKKAVGDDSSRSLVAEHRPLTKRPHVAQEYQDRGSYGVAKELVRGLRPRHQFAVIGFHPYYHH